MTDVTPDWTVVAAFTSVHQAHFARSVLEAAGIDSQIADEHVISMDWFLSNLVGGVKLLVRADRVDEAKTILASDAMNVEQAQANGAVADDPFELQRFFDAQEGNYEQALAEIRAGLKQSHWMWFIFPQHAGLGTSPTSQHFAITGAAEARAYLAHPVLGPRLMECAAAAVASKARSAVDVFRHPDDLKLRSSATLFAAVSAPGSVFERLLDKWFGGEPDKKTLALLA